MVEPPVVAFAGLLRQLRTEAGLTQEELAAAAGLSARSVSDLERGVALTARNATARLLADALGLAGPARASFEAVARGRAPSGVSPPPGIRLGGVAAATRALPRDIASFTGRYPELRQLVGAVTGAAASAGVVGIHAIGGMAGVGKTAFAVHAAHQMAPRFTDGQIFLPLHGHTPGQRPVNPVDALANLLLTAGVPAAQIPPGLEARTALWRDRLAGKQLLLLLDDASDSDQVRPLLPGTAGTLVLVTSRRHLTALDDAQAVSLDTLQAREAAELLVRLAARPGLEPGDGAVAKIARLCGYLPLAVGMLARQLHHHPAWTAAELAADLEAARDRLEMMHAESLSVAAAFDLSYQELTPGQQQLFRRLGLHPGPDIDAYAAAALGGTDLATARRNLGGLYDQYLITEPVHGRYRFHDLVREHARSLAATDPPADQDAALGRLLEYYLHVAGIADLRIAPYKSAQAADISAESLADRPLISNRDQAVVWMDAERLNLNAAVDCAAGTGRLRQAAAIPGALHEYLLTGGHLDQAQALHRTAAISAQRSGDRNAQAAALVNLGRVQERTRDLSAAIATLTTAFELYRDLGDRNGEAEALTRMADVQWLTDDYPAATVGLTRALELFREAGNQNGEATALNRLGAVQDITGNHSAAAASLNRALAIFRGLGNRQGEALALRLTAAMQYNTNDYLTATASVGKALELYRDLGDQNEVAAGLSLLGAVQWITGDDTAAVSNLTQSVQAHRELCDPRGEANALTYLGGVRSMTGDYRDATANLSRALELSRDIGDSYVEAIALIYLGAVQSMTGDYPAATATLTCALGLCRDDMSDLQAEALNYLGELSLAAGNPGEAFSRYTQALTIAREKGSRLEKARALEGIGRCRLSDRRTSDAATHLRQALAIYEEIGSRNARRVSSTLHAHGLA